MGRVQHYLAAACVLATAWAMTAPAAAQTGVSDDRVSLPEGPGSLEGVGENVSVDGNMGLLSHKVMVEVPTGFAGLTPDVSLSYSSGNGNGVIGMGWGMMLPAIERLTLRGLPDYDLDDEFAVNGSEQLVRIPATDPPIYRARFEKGFVRYAWLGTNDGTDGYWRAEYPDGRIGYFGATAAGTPVANARVTGPEGTFRYHLTEMVDRYGHRLTWSYNLYGNVTLPVHVGWVYDNLTPRYEVTFEYEDRTDKQSDCRPGFEELLEKRLSRINVRGDGALIRHYELTYEDAATSGGMSRVATVQSFGRDGGLYPIAQTFSYTQALGAECQDGNIDCDKPYVVTMPTALGVNITAGNTTLLDINGDGLADILDTSLEGAHRFFINTLVADQPHDFAPANASSVGTQNTHDLSSMAVQVLDVNGDGFTDILNAQQGTALINRGQGDWEPAPLTLWEGAGAGGLPSDFVPSDGELATVRFLDYDNDKRIDVIKSTGSDASNATLIYRNTGTGAFQLADGVQPIGAAFDSETLELNDMNGDGLLDPVQVQASLVRYRLNLGKGVWGEWREITGFGFTDQEQVEAELEDLNGDALADIVIVSGSEVRYWLNRNSNAFEGPITLTSDDVEGGLPTKEDKVVLFADINGNGSSDVVWIDANGQVTYLEFFPIRPNLLTRIENGIGKVTRIRYASSVEEQALSGGPGSWTYDLPHPMTVVKEVDEADSLSAVHLVTRYRYEHGYFDASEKDFRGYERVVTEIVGDDRQETGERIQQYDVGVEDDYQQGLLLWQEAYSGGELMSRMDYEYSDCEVAEVPTEGLLFPVRHVCKTLDRTESRERMAAQQAATVETATHYDGYGQVTLTEERGVVAMGGGACPACTTDGYSGTPCGPQCLGDERYSSTEYVTPGSNDDIWILGRPIRERTYGEADGNGGPATDVYTETLTWYDGADFVGLPFGKLTAGTPTRVEERVDATGATIATSRVALDEHGNAVEEISANGSLDDPSEHRRRRTWDALGLNIVATELALKDTSGPYTLRQELVWDDQFGQMVASSERFVVGSGAEPAWTHYTLDEFGRRTAVTQPGDDPAKPSKVYSYELAAAGSRIIAQRRTTADGPLDLMEVSCVDGHGRTYQTRTRLAEGQWLVSGFRLFGAHGRLREEYSAYHATGGECDLAPPAQTPSRTMRMDAMGRIVRVDAPVGHDDPEPAVQQWQFAPLVEHRYDAEDTRTGGDHEGTPTTIHTNGLGQMTAWSRTLADGTTLTHTLSYDPLGNVRSTTDPAGLVRTMAHDFVGRTVSVMDPDRGVVSYEYDDNGNVVRQEDALGNVLRTEYDAANREVRRWAESDEAGTLVTFRYDRALTCAECVNGGGRLVEASFALGDGSLAQDELSYSLRGDHVRTARTVRGRTLTASYEYDRQGRMVRSIWPDGRTLDYTFDGEGRVTAIDGVVDSASYHPSGGLASASLANGTQLERTYDERSQPVDRLVIGPNGDPILAWGYVWDRVGNLTRITDERQEEAGPMSGANYAYDALYRLTTAHLDPDRPAYTETVSYVWDDAERMVGKSSSLGAESPAHVGAITYGEDGAFPRAVSQAGTLTYAYDAAGRMTGRGNLTFERDAYGSVTRVVDASDSSAEPIGVMAYDPDGRRLIHRSRDHLVWEVFPSFEVRDFASVLSVELAGERIARLERPAFASMVLSDIAPAQGSDDALNPAPDAEIGPGDAWLAQAVAIGAVTLTTTAPVSEVTDLLDATTARLLGGAEDRVRYEYRDHLRSVAAVTDAQGAVLGRTLYYPLGQVRSGADDEPSLGFTGKERDPSSLIFFGARYLDPLVGRWASPDPHFESDIDTERLAESVCNYSYVMGRPTSGVDQDGDFVVTAVVVLSAVFVATVAASSYAAYKYMKQTDGMLSLSDRATASEMRSVESKIVDLKAESFADTEIARERAFNSETRVLSKTVTRPMSSQVTVTVLASEPSPSSYDTWRAAKIADGGMVGSVVGLFSSMGIHDMALERRARVQGLKKVRARKARPKSKRLRKPIARRKSSSGGRVTPGGGLGKPTPGGPGATPGGPVKSAPGG